MIQFKMRNIPTWGAGCLSLAFLAGCIGVTSPSGNSGDASLSTQTKGGVVDTSKAGCGHQDLNVDGKDNKDSAKDSAEVGGCDEKDHHDGKDGSIGKHEDADKSDGDKVGDKESKDSPEVKIGDDKEPKDSTEVKVGGDKEAKDSTDVKIAENDSTESKK